MEATSCIPGFTAEAAVKATNSLYGATYRFPTNFSIQPEGLLHPPSLGCLRECYEVCGIGDFCNQCFKICSGGDQN